MSPSPELGRRPPVPASADLDVLASGGASGGTLAAVADALCGVVDLTIT